MKKRIIKLNENDIESLVRKIIREEDNSTQPKERNHNNDNNSTMTRHSAYPAIDRLETELEKLKMEFKDSIANAVSGMDGYHSEIDKFSEDFGKFITKVSNLKSKINKYQLDTKEQRRRAAEQRKASYMAQHNDRKNKASKQGKNYSY